MGYRTMGRSLSRIVVRVLLVGSLALLAVAAPAAADVDVGLSWDRDRDCEEEAHVHLETDFTVWWCQQVPIRL